VHRPTKASTIAIQLAIEGTRRLIHTLHVRHVGQAFPTFFAMASQQRLCCYRARHPQLKSRSSVGEKNKYIKQNKNLAAFSCSTCSCCITITHRPAAVGVCTDVYTDNPDTSLQHRKQPPPRCGALYAPLVSRRSGTMLAATAGGPAPPADLPPARPHPARGGQDGSLLSATRNLL
jgi:hypothetical protein